jgi:hypothetical protein
MTGDDATSPGDDEAQVEFPDSFLEQLERLIPNPAFRDMLLTEAVVPYVRQHWRQMLESSGLEHDAAVGTPDGYNDAPALWLWCWIGHSASGRPFVVFNRAVVAEPSSDAEDDS